MQTEDRIHLVHDLYHGAQATGDGMTRYTRSLSDALGREREVSSPHALMRDVSKGEHAMGTRAPNRRS